MRWRILRRVIVLAAILALPVATYAQEAILRGTVRDSTGAVLPGVVVTAVQQATGNTFEGVTDAYGVYRMVVRAGVYEIRAALPGFVTVVRPGIEVLVGQEVGVNLELAVTGVEETVTVTGEAPLLETTESSVGGNIDSRQMADLPVQGRDWMALALLAPGNRTTSIGGDPVEIYREDNIDYALNLDGQMVMNATGVGSQPRYSRDQIAEFEFVSNRFDATQGRSPAAQVNAITRSGTNTFAGSVGAYFRDSEWGAKDHVLGVKVPFENQQVSTTLGGPIVRDRLHFFANYEYDRTPRTSIANTPYPEFNVTIADIATLQMAGGRVDYQFSPDTRLMFRVTRADSFSPGSLGTDHPSGASSNESLEYSYFGNLTQVLSNRAVNQIKVGYSRWGFHQEPYARWSNHWQASNGITAGAPRLRLRGFSTGGSYFHPRDWIQKVYTLRDDFTYSFEGRGRHDLEIGGEFVYYDTLSTNCLLCMGQIQARGGPIPGNVVDLFPDVFNVDTWNLNALSPITQYYQLGIAERFHWPSKLPKTALWVQDDWQMSEDLTLNLGLRYDLIWNGFGQEFPNFEPWVVDRAQDANNIQPRVGFAYQLNDRTVLRGGGGLYYADIPAAGMFWAALPNRLAILTVFNDGRPDFATNPFNGPVPTFESARERFCDINNNAPGCLLRSFEELPPAEAFAHVGRKAQVSVGVQRQLAAGMVIAADYVYQKGNNEKIIQANINLTYDEAGNPRPFSDPANRFDPKFGSVGMVPMTGWSKYHGLQASWRKRFSDNWQASATYTLSGFWTGDPLPVYGHSPTQMVPNAPKDISDYGLAGSDQRHRAVFNGIWQVGGGFQLSGLYFYGSGMRHLQFWGDDLRDQGETYESIPPRLRDDGTVVPRYGLVGDPIHRVDIRLQQSIPLGSRVKVDGIFEVFNLFDRANYGGYEGDELHEKFGDPLYSSNLAFSPRTLQLGFRLTF